jgi:hypothetical protein
LSVNFPIKSGAGKSRRVINNPVFSLIRGFCEDTGTGGKHIAIHAGIGLKNGCGFFDPCSRAENIPGGIH